MIKKLRLEFPVIKYNGSIFDLEIENFKSVEHLIDFIEDILEGNKFKDKYGYTIELTSAAERKAFLSDLRKDKLFKDFVNNKLSKNEKRLLNIIFDRFD